MQNWEPKHFLCVYPEDPTLTYTAQWVACNTKEPPDDKWAFASYPGAQGVYQPGDYFDVWDRHGQSLITNATSEVDRAAAQAECFERLKLVIDGIKDGE